ncbi:hypothetical protein PI125_g14633 [Phytophthora idaei]|nr:hypothetical protein PI125_g14633 [Phytophthora idaei]
MPGLNEAEAFANKDGWMSCDLSGHVARLAKEGSLTSCVGLLSTNCAVS